MTRFRLPVAVALLVVLTGCLGGALGDGASNPTPESDLEGEAEGADDAESGASSAAASDGNELNETDDEPAEAPNSTPTSTPAESETETPEGNTETPGGDTETEGTDSPSTPADAGTETEAETETPPAELTETESSGESEATGDGTPADGTDEEGDVHPDNPYGSERLTVAVDLRGTDRDALPVVKRALAFWEENAERHAGYPVEYELVERGAVDSPDVVVTVSDDPLSCGWGDDDEVVGCAPWNTEEAPETTEVEIRGDLTDRGLYEALVHELGHTLGLSHTDEPQEFMVQDRPTGVERTDTTVLVETEGDVDEAAVQTQTDAALGYYERGADGTLAPADRPDYERTNDPAEADLILTVTDDPDACPDLDGAGSCFTDGEYRDQTRIVVAGIENDAVAYYVATLLAYVYYDDASETPHPVSADATAEERSSEWWTDG